MNNNEGVKELFEYISKEKKRIVESPLTMEVRKLMATINEEALEGKGSVDINDTNLTLGWEGKITKKEELRREGEPFVILVNPFNISINIFTTEGGSSVFRVTAKYFPDSEPKEIRKTLDIKELHPILKSEIPQIKQSAKR